MSGIEVDAGDDSELNMTPMIDIVFQLIIFFLLSLKLDGFFFLLGLKLDLLFCRLTLDLLWPFLLTDGLTVQGWDVGKARYVRGAEDKTLLLFFRLFGFDLPENSARWCSYVRDTAVRHRHPHDLLSGRLSLFFF